jgi:hypothetical protein
VRYYIASCINIWDEETRSITSWDPDRRVRTPTIWCCVHFGKKKKERMNESMGPRLLFKHLGDLDCTGADGNSKGKINNQKLLHKCFGDLALQFVQIFFL